MYARPASKIAMRVAPARMLRATVSRIEWRSDWRSTACSEESVFCSASEGRSASNSAGMTRACDSSVVSE